MQGLGGLLCLATVAIEALLSVMAAALSGFGLFFRVSFRWGHDDLLRIVMSSIPTYMKETMSHLASISKRQTRGEDAPAPPSYKPFMMNGFHGVSSENPHQCLLKFMFGKARLILHWCFVLIRVILPAMALAHWALSFGWVFVCFPVGIVLGLLFYTVLDAMSA